MLKNLFKKKARLTLPPGIVFAGTLTVLVPLAEAQGFQAPASGPTPSIGNGGIGDLQGGSDLLNSPGFRRGPLIEQPNSMENLLGTPVLDFPTTNDGLTIELEEINGLQAIEFERFERDLDRQLDPQAFEVLKRQPWYRNLQSDAGRVELERLSNGTSGRAVIEQFLDSAAQDYLRFNGDAIQFTDTPEFRAQDYLDILEALNGDEALTVDEAHEQIRLRSGCAIWNLCRPAGLLPATGVRPYGLIGSDDTQKMVIGNDDTIGFGSGGLGYEMLVGDDDTTLVS